MHGSKSHGEEESLKTRHRSVCVIADLHEGKYSRLPIRLCLSGPRRHLFPYVCTYARSLTSIYRREKCSALVRQLCHFPPCQIGTSVLPKLLSQSHVQLPAPKRQPLETARRTRARRGSRVRRQRLGWKNTFFHMVLLSDLCWLVLARCGSWISPQRVPLKVNGLLKSHTSPMCERSGLLATLGSDKTSIFIGNSSGFTASVLNLTFTAPEFYLCIYRVCSLPSCQ